MLLHGVVIEGDFRFPSFIKVMYVYIQFLKDVTLLSIELHILPHLILLETG